MRVVIAPDSFKGSITAIAAAAALAAGWRDARPADVVTTLPLADGGDHHPHRAPIPRRAGTGAGPASP